MFDLYFIIYRFLCLYVYSNIFLADIKYYRINIMTLVRTRDVSKSIDLEMKKKIKKIFSSNNVFFFFYFFFFRTLTFVEKFWMEKI